MIAHAPGINITSCWHIIKSINYNIATLDEFVRKSPLTIRIHSLSECHNVIFVGWHHLHDSCSSSCTLGLTNVRLSKEKLSGQIAVLNVVWISYYYLAFQANPSHRHIFKQLTTDSSSSYY